MKVANLALGLCIVLIELLILDSKGYSQAGNVPQLSLIHQRESLFTMAKLQAEMQTTILYEGFENGGNIPSGWIDSPASYPWEYNNGVIHGHGPGHPHSGSYAAYFDIYDYPDGAEDTLISPSMNLSMLGVHYVLTFWSWQWYQDGYDDSVGVWLSESNVNRYLGRVPISNSWSQTSFEFNSMDTNVKIKFIGVSDYGYYAPFLDDVLISELEDTFPYQAHFCQLDLGGDSLPAVSNSTWGQFQATVDPPPESLLYINVVADSANSGVQKWIVRNLPIIPVSMDSTPRSINTIFSLAGIGGQIGVPIDVLLFGIDSSWIPRQVMPNLSTLYPARVSHDRYNAEGRPGGPLIDFGDPADLSNLNFPFQGPFEMEWYGDMPNVQCGRNECAPAASANGLSWLVNRYRYGSIFTAEELLDTLKNAGHMNTDPRAGTRDYDVIMGKLKMINELDLPLAVNFQNYNFGDSDIDTPYGIAIGQGDLPTFEWIESQINQGDGLELGFLRYDSTGQARGGHWITLQGIIDFGPGARGLFYRHDTQQGNDTLGTDASWFSWLNVRQDAFLSLFNESRNKIDFAVAEIHMPYINYCPGDANGNGVFNAIDIIYSVNYLKGIGSPPPDLINCPPHGLVCAAADANGNCQFNAIDVTYSVNYLMGIGPAPQGCADCPPWIR
jgi:hypothetical protein